MLKQLTALLLIVSFTFAMVATAVSDVSGQTKRVKRCYYTDVTKKRTPQKGCNSCTRLLKVEQDIAILLSKKPDERTWAEAKELATLNDEFDKLVDRVKALEDRMDAMDKKTDTIRDDLNTETARNDDQETRIQTLENGCYVFSKMVKKGKKVVKKLYERCNNGKDLSEVEPDGKGGWSVKKKIIVGGIFVGVGLGLLCLFGVICGGDGYIRVNN